MGKMVENNRFYLISVDPFPTHRFGGIRQRKSSLSSTEDHSRLTL
jgi:hypothetical protein